MVCAIMSSLHQGVVGKFVHLIWLDQKPHDEIYHHSSAIQGAFSWSTGLFRERYLLSRERFVS